MEAAARPAIDFDAIADEYRSIVDLEPDDFRLLCETFQVDPAANYFKATWIVLEKIVGTNEAREFCRQCGEKGI